MSKVQAVWFLAYVALLAAACWTDASRRRIPNTLVLWGSAAGLAVAAMHSQVELYSASAGLAEGFAIGFILYATKLVGAGDAKLIGATGAYVGFPQVMVLILFVLVGGGVVALAWALWRRNARQALENVRYGLMQAAVAAASTLRPPSLELVPTTTERYPYAFAVALGAVAHQLFLRYANG